MTERGNLHIMYEELIQIGKHTVDKWTKGMNKQVLQKEIANKHIKNGIKEILGLFLSIFQNILYYS